jgi:glycosyltransferase involved in cell wall biosynthesis
MVANVTGQKWPSKKLVWILVDDGSLAAEVATLKGIIEVVHVIVPEPASIGLKRNRGILAAPADVTRFVVMDDDDHYPPDSVGRRLPWISIAATGASYCSTLPMYDVTRYISAMNVPPLTLAPAERVSEASLAFTRAFWSARPFPEVSMAEGEGFLAGREQEAVEIPPYGIMVSFIHGANVSGRRVPANQEPNGCHYGFKDEYFRYIHGLVTE